jgi:hypothetical protein
MVAGSGLIKAADGLWAVGDDLHHLIHIPWNDEVASGHRMFSGDLPEDFKERKKLKPDTEAFFEITRRGQEAVWLAMPSGSKPNRVKGAVIRKSEKLDIRERDFTPLYEALSAQIPGLNIEGATILNDDLVFFQRGNGEAGLNALVFVSLADFIAGFRSGQLAGSAFRVQRVELGEWQGAAITFTDGFAHDGKLIFSAAAERTNSTYEDGEVVGSVIGIWDGRAARELGRVRDVKIEGLALDKATENEMTCFAITDADESLAPSQLLRLIFDTL